MVDLQDKIKVKEEVTRKVTQLIAAEFISKPSFPGKEILSLSRGRPFINFGHQPLLNMGLLLKILWHAVENIQSEIKKIEDDTKSKFAILLIVTLFLGIPASIFIHYSLGIFIALVGIIMYKNISGSEKKKSERIVAGKRAWIIKELITNRFEGWISDDFKTEISKAVEQYGDGIVNDETNPILIILDDNHPFPGFGRLQAEVSYICLPTENVLAEIPDINKIEEDMWGSIKNKVINTNLPNIFFGEVVVAHGQSISINSDLLDESKAPFLEVKRNKVHDLLKRDTDNSIRVYKAIQLLFPEYLTIASFFIKPTLVGNSLSCHLALTTLGPPSKSIDYFYRKLHRYEYEKKFYDNSQMNTSGQDSDPIGSNNESDIAFLEYIKIMSKDWIKFQEPVNTSDVLNLKIKKSKSTSYTIKQFKNEFDEIVKSSNLWPGALLMPNNLRESKSNTFTADFFGRQEGIASVKAMYDQISKAILDSFDNIGFDVSNYRDTMGNYTISADKIDQLVVGEKIHLQKESEKNDKDSNLTKNAGV